jgi:hypothetical protein
LGPTKQENKQNRRIQKEKEKGKILLAVGEWG